MSKTKGGGSTRNGRDSNAQRLGVKVFDGGLGHGRVDHRAPTGHPLPSRARVSAGATTTPCSPWSMAMSASPTATAGAWWTSTRLVAARTADIVAVGHGMPARSAGP